MVMVKVGVRSRAILVTLHKQKLKMRYSRGKLVQIAKVVIGWSLLVVVVLAFSVLLLIKVRSTQKE